MKLAHRLMLNGAIIPSFLLLSSLAGASWLFDHWLLESVDHALVIQAALEASSIFDGPETEPHRHTDRTPLQNEVRSLTAIGGLYTVGGDLVVAHPSSAIVPKHIALGAFSPAARLQTLRSASGADERELVVGVTSPRGESFQLRLVTSLANHEATMALLYRSGAAAGLLTALLLVGLQTRHASALMRRIRALAAHMERLRGADFAELPQPDTTGDVLSSLRDAVAETTLRLRAARETSQRFLADAAHEMRTPVAAMSVDIDVTLRRERDVAELREALQRSRRVAARLTRLSNDLLDLTAQRHTSWDCPLADVVQGVTETMASHQAAALERGIELVLSGAPRLEARFHPDALRQVVTNLLNNALRYAPRGTSVRLHLDDAAERWQLVVEDDGPGVPAETREAVFEPFHRPDRRGEGAGLGLAIVRDVARRHGGRAFVEAAASGGARFVMEIPHFVREIPHSMLAAAHQPLVATKSDS